MDDRYYPTERMREKLDIMRVPRDKQDLLTLFLLLPGEFRFEGADYQLVMTKPGHYNIVYRGWGELFREGDSLFPDAVAKTVIYLLERKIVSIPHE